MKNQLLVCLCIFFLVSACDKLAIEVDAPITESKLVVFSFISPEENFTKVEVTLSKPVYGKTPSKGSVNYVTDALVEITDENWISATLTYVDTLDGYAVSKSAYPIQPGITYTIKVNGAGKSSSGQCRVPPTIVPFSEVSYIKLADPSSSSFGPYYKYAYKWKDEPSAKNFYRVNLEKQYSYVFEPGDTETYQLEICNSIWDDTNKDATLFTGTCEDYGYFYSENDTTSQPLDLYLLNTDIHYFEYHKRRLNYYGDDPFSEPFPQYSNMSGGLGVFCAFRRSKSILLIR